ncbi:O-antigen ligase [Aquimarina sp. MAR_2010_214]|uniref:O-antigen ligase family protein n=1 Tax=Aquimarina sp. MAR_2010_214 TaxID=1250026 RepID=UPI001304527F|nr:O-antigen ligase family protein [Aquimarina sp. MAR_2010_214]
MSLLSLFAFSIPLLTKLSTIILIVLAIYSLFCKKNNNFKRLPFLLFPILYILTIIFVLFSKNIDLSLLEQRASFIAFPIIFWALKIEHHEYMRILKLFVLGCVTAILICFIYAFYNSFSIVNGYIFFQPVVNEEFSFFYSVVRDGNYFFSDFFSIFHQTTYFSIYLNTAIAIILSYSLWKKHKLYLLYLILFLIGIFQLSSKAGIFTIMIISLFFIFTNIQNILSRLILVIIIIITGVFTIVNNPRGKIMVDEFFDYGISFEPSERYGFALRLMSWNSAIEILKKHPFLGVSIGDVQNELNKVYTEKGYKTPLEKRFNAHNQFLQFYLEYGLIGLISTLLILYFIVNINKHKNNDRKLNVSIFLILFFNFFYESMINRYSGISYILFFYYLIDCRYYNNKEIE